MRFTKILAAVVPAALIAVIGSGTASATILTSPSGTQVSSGTVIKGELEGTSTLHPPIGDIECKKSTFEGKTTNSGGASETVKIALSSLSFGECNATVTVLKTGSLEIHTEKETANGNGTVTANGLETTVEFAGFHCIYDGGVFLLGVVVGGVAVAAVIVLIVVLVRTGGRSGAFCGSKAEWTGRYKIISPQPLLVD